MAESTDVMISDQEESQMISTLVFMDLEATGLPSFMGKRNVHITEMSFVAVDRQNFETDNNFRVINKLSLCIRPRAAISPGAMSITGLYNDMLEKQEKFDDSIPKLLDYFFRRLQKPLCLLAHNGNRYDFPLLQAELRNINYTLDPEILCADTLEAIRYIVSNPSIQPSNAPTEKDADFHDPKVIQAVLPDDNKDEQNDSTKQKDDKNDDFESEQDSEIEILLTQDLDLFKDIEEPNFKSEGLIDKSGVSFQSGKRQHLHADDFTPPKPIIVVDGPKQIHRKKPKLDPTWLPKKQYKTGVSTNFRHIHAKRQLFTDGIKTDGENKTNSELMKSKPAHFSLEKLYYHYFGENPPTSHYAEADCIALSKVCQKINKDFLKWIDENSMSFSDTVAMW